MRCVWCARVVNLWGATKGRGREARPRVAAAVMEGGDECPICEKAICKTFHTDFIKRDPISRVALFSGLWLRSPSFS